MFCLCFLFLYVLTISVRIIISTFTGPIFAKLAVVGRIIAVDDQSEISFSLSRGTLPRQPISVGLILGWWRGTVVERRSLAGELSLSCARPAADG